MHEISIVVPIYKVEPYLHRCIDSILSQTYPDFRLILVDDGSPDNCGQICDEYAEKDSRIHVIHRENGGLSAARNSGIDWVFDGHFTEWITFIDSDDWVVPNYLEDLFRAVNEEAVSISIGGFVKAFDNTEIRNDTIETICYSPEEFWVIDQGKSTVAWGKLYKTDLFTNYRYPEGKLHEDEFTTYKLLFQQQQIAVISEPLYYYYQSPNSIMRSKWTAKRLDSLEAYEEQMLFFHQNRYHLAYKESEILHTYSLKKNIKEIKKSSEKKVNMALLYSLLSNYLKRRHNSFLFGFPLICRLYILKTNIKLYISVRWSVLKRIRKEKGIIAVFRKILFRSN